MTKRTKKNPFLEELFSDKPVDPEIHALFDEVFIMLGTHERNRKRKRKESQLKYYEKRKLTKKR